MRVAGESARALDAGDEMGGAAVAKIVAIDAGDDDVLQAARRSSALGSPGSSASSRSGRPWPTSQNGQRRVRLYRP
jgi:hypothetical protein